MKREKDTYNVVWINPPPETFIRGWSVEFSVVEHPKKEAPDNPEVLNELLLDGKPFPPPVREGPVGS